MPVAAGCSNVDAGWWWNGRGLFVGQRQRPGLHAMRMRAGAQCRRGAFEWAMPRPQSSS
jgi:hypothetical protein